MFVILQVYSYFEIRMQTHVTSIHQLGLLNITVIITAGNGILVENRRSFLATMRWYISNILLWPKFNLNPFPDNHL